MDTQSTLTAKAVQLRVKRLRPVALPVYATKGSSGLDICADVEGDIEIPPGCYVTVPTGLSLAVPEGYEVQVRPRSGLAHRFGVTVLNAPGTIDADYRGEVQVILINLGHSPYTVRKGDRIAQLVVMPVVRAEVIEVSSLEETERGSGGFGSTGY